VAEGAPVQVLQEPDRERHRVLKFLQQEALHPGHAERFLFV